MTEVRLVQGNEACALGALAAGCNFFGGYPITPSSEVAEHMARALPDLGGVFVQMEDEIASLGAVLGASLAGAKAMTATSGPGFSLMQEHIGFGAIAEVPCVIVDVMRAGPSTGMPTSPSQGDVMQARWGTHGDRPAIVLAPASVAEIYELTIRAFNLSERFRTPVILMYDEVVGHTREGVSLPERVDVWSRERPVCPPDEYLPSAAGDNGVAPLAAFGDGYRFHVTGLTHDERGFPTNDPAVAGAQITRMMAKVEDHTGEIVDVERFLLDDADTAIVAYGIVARAAKEAVTQARAAGVRVGLLRPITLWPFPESAVRSLADQVSTIVVAEMNLGQVVREVERCVLGRAEVRGLLRADGEPIAPAEIVSAVGAGATFEAVASR